MNNTKTCTMTRKSKDNLRCGLIPIDWFGDREAYNESKVKVVTVGLNPSDKEFRESATQPFSTSLRFKHYQTDKPRLEQG